MNRTVLITGASGFVGRHLTIALRAAGRDVRAAFRSVQPATPGVDSVQVGSLGPDTDWTGALHGIDTVVHLAARVHVMQDKVLDPLAEFRRVNVEGTLALARQAAAAGVRRFVFVSSIKVNGETTSPGKPFTADDTPAPQDAYGISKYEAETGLLALSAATGMEVVIIRPVLVYGPGVGANFLSMMRWLKKGVPLPLGAIRNRRSMVALDNLVDLIAVCMDHPAASGQVFLASDGEDLSTPDLLRRTASALGTRAFLVPVPAIFLKVAAGLIGKGDVAQRLCGSLQADISKNRVLLGWTPPVSVDAGLVMAARHLPDRGD
ncbi:MAG: SDR family oxidoreductase [Polaromonas sp.]|uniref:UDP-glucose 4-epimerase family protein n=1 Tax=Polaromonas sp. TaxID=1869339 RepID=UPI0025D95E68|nr:SDR family oxidoreductase [Polaromonas sp.]MBI2725927.1 SDR family oxidoreductase [Polaromonas sp.]